MRDDILVRAGTARIARLSAGHGPDGMVDTDNMTKADTTAVIDAIRHGLARAIPATVFENRKERG